MSDRQNKRGRRTGTDSPASTSSGSAHEPARQQHQTSGPSTGSRRTGDQQATSQPSTSSQSPVPRLTPSTSQAAGRAVAVRGRGRYRNPWEPELSTIPAGITSTMASDTRPLRFFTNYFKLNRDEKASQIRLYRVDFEPIVDNDDMRARLVRQYTVPLFNDNYIYDRGNDLQSAIVLPQEVTTVLAKHPADGSDIRITLKNTGIVDDFNYLRTWNIQMNEYMRKMGFFKMQNSYFHPELATNLPGNLGLSRIGGFNTTTSLLSGGVMVSLESRSKIIQDASMLRMINAIHRQYPGDFRERIRNAMTSKVVITKYNNRTYRIEDVDFDRTPESTFPRRDGALETYVNYYRNAYNLNVTDRGQPLFRAKVDNVERRRRQAEMAGDSRNADTPIMLIPEFCYMTSLTDEQEANMSVKQARIQASQVSPTDRVAMNRRFLAKLHSTPYVTAKCQSWKYSYERDLVELGGRQLEQVDIITGDSNRRLRTKCQNASFDNALRNTQIYEVPSLQYLTLIMGRGRNDPPGIFATMTSALQRSMDSVGLRLRPDQVNRVVLPDTAIRTYLSACRELPDRTTIVLCLLPDQSKDRYDAIKRHLSVEQGIPSQCFLTKHFRTPGPRTASACNKIAVQIAAKIGGVPWAMEIPASAKYMICGYDAWHDSVTTQRSWGAFCSSLNSNFTRWWSKANHHDQLEELSTNLANNVFEGVLKYREFNKALPEKIFIYRDGVGQGDLDHVFTIEIKRIKQKLEKLEKEAKKKIQLAVIVVTKRIGARFFLKKPQPNQFDNPPPGTVIDSEITRRTQYDFYLVSHHTRNGTITPTMYNVIEDTTGLRPGAMQTLAYKLCHLYFNWSGAVRVPAPCQYAHKLAYLVGESLHSTPNINLDKYLHYL